MNSAPPLPSPRTYCRMDPLNANICVPDGKPAAPNHTQRNAFICIGLIGMAAMVLLFFLPLSGCASAPQSIRPVIAHANDAQSRLALSYASDLKGYRRVVEANLQAQRVILVGNIRREFITRDYVVTDAGGREVADVANFERDLSDATVNTALVEEVRIGRMTKEKAITFLSDYAALGAVSDSGMARNALLGTLHRVSAFDAATKEIGQAFDTHAEQVAGMFAETGASLDAVATLADAPNAAEVLTNKQAWSVLITSLVKDTKKQTAILDAITTVGTTVTR